MSYWDVRDLPVPAFFEFLDLAERRSKKMEKDMRRR